MQFIDCLKSENIAVYILNAKNLVDCFHANLELSLGSCWLLCES